MPLLPDVLGGEAGRGGLTLSVHTQQLCLPQQPLQGVRAAGQGSGKLLWRNWTKATKKCVRGEVGKGGKGGEGEGGGIE